MTSVATFACNCCAFHSIVNIFVIVFMSYSVNYKFWLDYRNICVLEFNSFKKNNLQE